MINTVAYNAFVYHGIAPPQPALQPYGLKKWHHLSRMSGVPGPLECGLRR